MVGGVISSFLLELLVYPAIYEMWKGWRIRHPRAQPSPLKS